MRLMGLLAIRSEHAAANLRMKSRGSADPRRKQMELRCPGGEGGRVNREGGKERERDFFCSLLFLLQSRVGWTGTRVFYFSFPFLSFDFQRLAAAWQWRVHSTL